MLECVEDGLTSPAAVRSVDAKTFDSEDGFAESPEKDPLEAVTGDVLAGRWEVRRRLGTGSTSRAFLVRDLSVAAEAQLPDQRGRRARELAVLKVALTDSRGEVLAHEAEVMRRLRPDSRIIRLIESETLRIGARTVLVLEYVGDEREASTEPTESGTRSRRRQETVARELREGGRLQVDQLEAYGDYLFGAVDFLEGEGVWHRDIKPDNIAIRIRPNRTRELVLLDFSLAGYPARETGVGTDGYLDPFIGSLARSTYDSHAERYSVAATLHQMASAELPKWGDGTVAPRQTDPMQWPYPTIAADAFDPAVRDGLVSFFRKALHRDAAQRFPELKPMRDAWRKIFLDASQARPSSHWPGARVLATSNAAPSIAEAEPDSAQEERERLAGVSTRETHLSAAGLTPPAESFLYGLGITTVGELLAYSQRNLVNAPGLGAKTRSEVQRRQRQWGERLREVPVSPLDTRGRREGRAELDDVSPGHESAISDTPVGGADMGDLAARTLRTVSLDTLATVFVPELNNNGANRNKAEMVRLLLRVPNERGELPLIGVWPKQKDVADALGLSRGRIPQLLKEERRRWRKLPAVQALREEILELLLGLGRIASAVEIADALAVRRGTRLHGRERRRALALAAVRALVEVEQLAPEESAFRHVPNRQAVDEAMGAGLLALEVGENDAPETPSAPGLLDYAQRLGRVADRLARLDTVPVATTVLSELGAVTPPAGVVNWDEKRLVDVAAIASLNAAATPRLEIYPRDLPMVRALRLTQAGLVRWIPDLKEELQPGLTIEDVHERVRARFPELVVPGPDSTVSHELPSDGPLTKALRDAGFDLKLATREGIKTLRYLPARTDSASSYLTSQPSQWTVGSRSAARYDDDPDRAAAALTEERLSMSAQRDGFRVLTVRLSLSPRAVRMLAAAPHSGERTLASAASAEVVSLTALFLEELRVLVRPGTKPTWETVLRADAAEGGSRSAMKFTEYARTAWGVVESRVRALMANDGKSGPLLLTDATVFARYDAMGVLGRLAEYARTGGRGLWLLVPQEDPARPPKLGSAAVPFQAALGEWIEIADSWLRETHRIPGGASGQGATAKGGIAV
jgi:serine/threonine protein kinase